MGQDHTLLHIPQKKSKSESGKREKKIRVAGEIFIINLNHVALTISCIAFPDVSQSTTPLQGTHIQHQFQFPFSGVSFTKMNVQYNHSQAQQCLVSCLEMS